MKKTVLLVLSCGFILGCGSLNKNGYKNVDEKDVRPKFVHDFQTRRQNVENVSWQMVDSNCYIANFTTPENNNQIRIKFRNTSVETYWNVPLEYTPSNITDYIKENYDGYKLTQVDIVEIRRQKSYYAQISKKKETKTLEFDLLGNFHKVVEEQ